MDYNSIIGVIPSQPSLLLVCLHMIYNIMQLIFIYSYSEQTNTMDINIMCIEFVMLAISLFTESDCAFPVRYWPAIVQPFSSVAYLGIYQVCNTSLPCNIYIYIKGTSMVKMVLRMWCRFNMQYYEKWCMLSTAGKLNPDTIKLKAWSTADAQPVEIFIQQLFMRV